MSITADLVEVIKVNPNIKLDIRYATANNFTGKVVYQSARCYARRSVAEKLDKVQKELEKQGLGLKIWDCYRPLSAQRKLWEICPNEKFVANPAKGGRHTRGTAVDLTLVRLSDGKELEMPTAFDDFTKQAHPDYTKGVSKEAITNRSLLAQTMLKYGFLRHPSEWWHFDAENWQSCQVLDVDFDQLERKKIS